MNWAGLPALETLLLEGVRLTDATAVGFSSLQQLSSLNIYAWAVDEDINGTFQGAIARLLRASLPALRSLDLLHTNVRVGAGGMPQYVPLTHFRPDLAAAVGGLTQLQQLACGDLGAACRLGQLQELSVGGKSWPDLYGWEIAMLGALTCLTRLELDSAPVLDPLSADRKRGVEQVRWAWESARLRQCRGCRGPCGSPAAGMHAVKTCGPAGPQPSSLPCCAARSCCGACCRAGAPSTCENFLA